MTPNLDQKFTYLVTSGIHCVVGIGNRNRSFPLEEKPIKMRWHMFPNRSLVGLCWTESPQFYNPTFWRVLQANCRVF